MDKQVNQSIGFVIQARMKSKRLPGKVLLPLPFIDGTPILGYIENALRSNNGKVIVATSINRENDQIYDFCLKNKIECFRGNEDDVLSRFIEIQEIHNFDCIVRLTADNPFIDHELINKVIEFHIKSNNDYTHSNGLPLGMNIEIFNGIALLKSKQYALNEQDREHVTLALKREEIFKKGIYSFSGEIQNHRLTVDTVQDYLTANIVAEIQKETKYNGIKLIEHIQEEFPWIFEGNGDIVQKNAGIHIKDEIEAAILVLEKLEF